MKTKTSLAFVRRAALVMLLATLNFPPSTFAQGTAFTYQGRLNELSGPANGNYDFKFQVFDSPAGGANQGGPATNNAVSVTDGLVTVTLDFGVSPLSSGAPRWLEIAVRTSGGGSFGILTPRQALTATPYAITAGNLTGTLPATQLSGTLQPAQLGGAYSGAVTLSNAANSFTGNGGGVTNVNAATLGGLSSSNFWKTTGNPGTSAGTHFLGTTDNQPLEIKVNGQRALRIEPNTNGAPNIIGGASANFVTAGVIGASISGGGAENYSGAAYTNSVSSDFGTIAGGYDNHIGTNSAHSAMGGGVGNFIADKSGGATIAGGIVNHIGTNSASSAMGGGVGNFIADNSGDATIAGGVDNHIGTNSDYSAIGGGDFNTIEANSRHSAIAGGGDNSIGAGSDYSAIGGGANNLIKTNSDHATIAGGESNQIAANSFRSAIAGGGDNFIGTGSDYSAIGGGYNNTIAANSEFGTIPGGQNNVATTYAFAAGLAAKANHTGAFVWADSTGANFASSSSNQFLIRAGGGVGIGTANPTAQLDVRGDVKLGSTGQLYATGGEENLRIIRGTVNADGTIVAGSGFTVNHNFTGVYDLNFITSFAGAPSTVASEFAGDTHLIHFTAGLNNTVKLYVRQISANVAEDAAFSFIAAGPR